MPKITNITKRIAGSVTQLVLSYNQKQKFHISAGIPEKMAQLVSVATLQDCDTENTLNYNLDKLISQYETLLKSERKVLLVTACVGRAMLEPLGIEYNDKHPLRNTNGGFDRGPENYGFDFKVEVAIETQVGATKKYLYLEQEEPSPNTLRGSGPQRPTISGNTQVIDYTPEREEFFKNLIVATIGLGERLRNFFNADEQLFLANIDGGQKLLS